MRPEAQQRPARPVMLDVARRAGVSLKTVSRVINEEPNVRPAVRNRVRAAIRALGYRPNSAARTLAARSSHVIGVVALGSALYGPASQMFGVERAAWQAGYSVVVSSLGETTTEELVRAVGELVDHGVDGIVIAAPVHVAPVAADELLQGIPAVSLDRFPDEMGLPAVLSDQRTGSRDATEHLLRLGHETVWHVAGPFSWHPTQERMTGWREALESAGIPVPEPVEGDWSAGTGYAIGRELAARPEVTAVFAANDHTAMGLMRAFFDAGRRIPDDVSIVGFDDVPEAEHLLIPLSTVRQDFEAATRRAVGELLSMLRADGRPAVPDLTFVPVELKIRASSGPPGGIRTQAPMTMADQE
ncbi:LacI family DNA-binding transcriptional regulator [Georgenia halophila]|uniref:LacI family DNA-binding transcriptional regulator n=1 Tax=Georgenia halophila TaxID=620889 RepID=A0ABP8L517_9MICO